MTQLINKEKKMTLTITKAISIGALLLALAATQLPAQSTQKSQTAGAEKTFTGVVSDSMCGATHMAKDKSPAECTRMCVQQGQKYALVVGTTVYTLQGHEAELDKLAGQRVTVKGTASGDTLAVSSVAPAEKKATS
jgi:hypothetical protein